VKILDDIDKHTTQRDELPYMEQDNKTNPIIEE